MTFTGLTAHGRAAPLVFLPFLKKLFQAAKSDARSYPYLSDIPDILQIILLHDPTLDEVFAFYIETIRVCHEYYAKYPQALRSHSYGNPQALQLGPYIYLHFQRTGSVRSIWLETLIQAALSHNDEAFFKPLFTLELNQIGIERQKPRIALDVLALFFKSIMEAPARDNNEIRQMMQAFLARLRLYYPDEVDDFLEEQQAPNYFRLQVQANEPAETMGVLVGDKARFFVLDEVLMNSPALLARFMRIFEKAVEYKHARDWLNYFIREIINVIYGGEALRQSPQV